MPFIIGGGGGGSEGALVLNNSHIFTTTTTRNTYFTANPSELREGLYISVSGTLQKRVGSSWVDATPLIRGPNGTNAPSPNVQYSVDGLSGWTSTIDTATHKYWRWSADGGVTWAVTSKFAAEADPSAGIPAPYAFDLDVSGKLKMTHNTDVITVVDDEGRWAVNSLFTANGDISLGETFYVGVAGEALVFKDETVNILWHSPRGGISPDGMIVAEPTVAVHNQPVKVALPAGAVGAGTIDYNTSFTSAVGAAYLYLDIIPKENYNGELTISVRSLPSNKLMSDYQFTANLVTGVKARVPFQRPIWLRAGRQISIKITKVGGSYLQVTSNIAGDAPYRESSYLDFVDQPLLHLGNANLSAAALNSLTGADRVTFSAIRDVPTMSSAVAGIAKLGPTMTINGLGELNTSVSPTSIPIVANQAARLAIPQSGGTMLAIQQDNGNTYGIEANQDPSVLSNWKQIGTVATSVVSFNGRSGAVIPTTGDYVMEQVPMTDITTAVKYTFRVDNGVPYLEEIA